VIGLDLTTPTEAQVRAARRAYYGALSYVDDQIGAVLTALGEAQLRESTIVFLIADHGDMLGERGLWYKMSFFEPACRIPLIVHAPGRFAPRRVSEPASLVDLLPTLLGLADENAPRTYQSPIDGTSLVPALEGGSAAGEVRGEYLAEGAIAPIVMMRHSRFKYIHSPADPDQLYDLGSDPDERANLAAVPEHAAVVAGLRAEVLRRWKLPELHAAVLASQRRRHLVYAALRQGRYRAWDFQPIRDATRSYVRNDQELNDLERMARFPQLP
jgi:choline-sulfatase